MSITAYLGDCPRGHPDGVAVFARVRLGRLTPAPVEQSLGGGHPRSWRRILVALAMPASTLTPIRCEHAPASVNWAEFSFGANIYGVGLPPSCWRRHIRVRRGDNHANNIAQKARTLLTEAAGPTFCDAYFRKAATFGSSGGRGSVSDGRIDPAFAI